MLVEAVRLYGVTEKQGTGNNPVILNWAKELGIKDYTADSIPWCALFVAWIAHKAGKTIPDSPLWALNWAKWGNPVKTPMLGDVLVFKRNGGGHVGLYVGEDSTAYHVLGGNQGDCVCVSRIAKDRLYACRNLYVVSQPQNCRRVFLRADGALSRNEA